MGKRIGKKEAVALLRKVVEKYGADMTYNKMDKKHASMGQGCRYVTAKGVPKCIVGVALVEFLGVDLGVKDNEVGNLVHLIRVREDIAAMFTPVAMDVLVAAQIHQDQDFSWGESVRLAARA